MKIKTRILIAAACGAVFSAGYLAGTIHANRRTLSRAIEVIDQMKTPVDSMNAQDAAAIVAIAARPRWRRETQWGEEYKPGCWVNTTPKWEKH